MPPKVAVPEGGLDPFVTFLLQVLATTEIEVKGADHYHLFGLKDSKNFARKVNDSAIAYGYKLDHGKMTRVDDAIAALKATKAGNKRTATPAAATTDDEDKNEESPTKKPKSVKSAKPAKGKGKSVKAEPKTEKVKVKDEDEASK